MFACQRITSVITKRQFHAAPAMLAEGESLFGKFNPWASSKKPQEEQEVTPAQHTDSETPQVTFNVKYQDEEDTVSWKRKDVLTDVAEIESTVKSVILQHVEGANEDNWNSLPVQDLNTKFQLLKESIKQTGKEVPNYEMNELNTTKDVLEFFKRDKSLTEKKTVRSYFEDNSESLPKNLKFVSEE